MELDWKDVHGTYEYVNPKYIKLAKVPFASMLLMWNQETNELGLYSEKYMKVELDALGDLLAVSNTGEDPVKFLQRTFSNWSLQASYFNFLAN